MQAAVAATVPETVTSWLRKVQKEGSYICLSAFLLFAMRFQRRPYIWKGENCNDLVHVFMPLAAGRRWRRCSVDGVACVLGKGAGLSPDWTEQDLFPCTEEHHLHKVRHWVAAVNGG